MTVKRSVFLEIACTICAEPIAYFRVLDGDDVRNVPMELQFIYCEKCKDSEVADRKNVDKMIEDEEEREKLK
jgi:hypothetical protein